MIKNMFKKVLLILLSLLYVVTLVGCESKTQEVTPDIKEEIVEVVDAEIKDAKYLKDALNYLHFSDVYLQKDYTLEDTTVYLMRLFGLEKEAIKKDYQCPYEGVNKNNEPIIAYAYATWLLTGITSEDLISSNENACNNTMAVLLRLMGYEDRGEEADFITSEAIEFAKTLDIDFNSESGKVRGDYLVKLLWDSLDKECKDGDTVKDKLGLFKNSEYEDAKYLAKGEKIPEKPKPVYVKPKPQQNSNVTDVYVGGGSSNDGGSSGGGGSSSGGGDSGSTGGGGSSDVGGGGDAGGGGGENETDVFEF